MSQAQTLFSYRFLKKTIILCGSTIYVIALFTNLGSWGVTETSEARYAEIAREMYESEDYLHPRLLKIGHYHKPPLTYWVTAAAYHLFGVNAFAARFFLQIAVLIQLYLVFEIGRTLFKDRKLALLAAIVYASFSAVLISGKALTTDAYLSTFVLAGILFWMKYRLSQLLSMLYLFYVVLGLGFLTKGPVIFLVTLPVVTGFNFLKKSKNMISPMHHFAGILIFFAIGLSWPLMLYLENPTFLDYFILDHTVNRVATDNFGRSKPFFFYLLILPITTFPWLLISLRPLFQRLREEFSIQHFFLIWIFVPLLVFSLIRSKLILYILPLYPGVALASVWAWQKLSNKSRDRWFWVQHAFQAMIILALLFAPWFDSTIKSDWSVLALLLLGVAFWIVHILVKISPYYRAPVSSVSFMLLLLFLTPLIFSVNPSIIGDQKNVAANIQRLGHVENIFVYNKRLPSLAFHLQRDIISLNNGHKSLQRETQFEKNSDWKNFLIDVNTEEDKLRDMLTESSSVFLVEKRKALPESVKWIKKYYQKSAEQDGWIIYY